MSFICCKVIRFVMVFSSGGEVWFLFVGVNFCNLFPLSHSIKSVGSIADLENSVAFVM